MLPLTPLGTGLITRTYNIVYQVPGTFIYVSSVNCRLHENKERRLTHLHVKR